MTEETYKVNGMTCGHCVAHVRDAVEELEGVESCDVSLDDGTATVVYDESKLGFEDIKAAVEDAGYEMEELD